MSRRTPSFRPAPPIAALVVFLVSLFGPFFASRCAAQDYLYLPLAVGNRWSYDNDFGFHEEQHVTGTIELFGRTAFVMRYVNSDVNEGLENYWIAEPSGDLYVCGYHRTLQGYGRLYDPPILWVDAPLWLDKSWSSTSSAFDRATSQSTRPFTGERFSKYWPLFGSTKLPPMKLP